VKKALSALFLIVGIGLFVLDPGRRWASFSLARSL